MFENEEWVPIDEFPHYLVSSAGRVKREDSPEARKVTVNARGVLTIPLTDGSGNRYLRQVNQLVAKAFLPPSQFRDETSVWHIDGDQTNCRIENLRWARRDAVLEWNAMHRPPFEPKYRTPAVKNNQTGEVYTNAYECGMAEGRLESYIVTRIELQARHVFDDNARYRYITD